MSEPFAIPEWARGLTPHVRDSLPATFRLVDGIGERHGSWQWTAMERPEHEPARWLVLAITPQEGEARLSVEAWQLTSDASEIVGRSMASALADRDSGHVAAAVRSVVRRALAVDDVESMTPMWLHLVVFLIDCSASMTAPVLSTEGPSKSEEAAWAVSRVLEGLRSSPRATNLWMADITFSDRLSTVRSAQPLLDIPPGESFGPTVGGGGGTDLRLGLDAARDVVTEFFARHQSIPAVSALVMLLTDGHDDHSARVTEAAKRVTALPSTWVAACQFRSQGEPSGGSELLSSIVSAPGFFMAVDDAEQVRRFYQSSVMATTEAARDHAPRAAPGSETPVTAVPVLLADELRNWELARDSAGWDDPTAFAVLAAGVQVAREVRARAALGHAASFSLRTPQAWVAIHTRLGDERERS